MKYKFVLTFIAIFTAFMLPTQVARLQSDGIPESSAKAASKIEPITTALTTKPTITPVPTAKPANTPPVAPQAKPSGSCADWVRAAGIGDVGNALELIRRESNCNPYARNSSSGACGVAQELPCGKSGCALGDGACQVRWMNHYVLSRYGSWAGAVSFHNANNWY